jgi:hypothetical protein
MLPPVMAARSALLHQLRLGPDGVLHGAPIVPQHIERVSFRHRFSSVLPCFTLKQDLPAALQAASAKLLMSAFATAMPPASRFVYYDSLPRARDAVVLELFCLESMCGSLAGSAVVAAAPDGIRARRAGSETVNAARYSRERPERGARSSDRIPSKESLRVDEEVRTVRFAAGSAAIQPAQREQLDALAGALKLRPELKVLVKGPYDPESGTSALRLKAARKRRWASR